LFVQFLGTALLALLVGCSSQEADSNSDAAAGHEMSQSNENPGKDDAAEGNALALVQSKSGQELPGRLAVVHLPASGCPHCRGTATKTLISMVKDDGPARERMYVVVSAATEDDLQQVIETQGLEDYPNLVRATDQTLQEHKVTKPFYPTIYHIDGSEIVGRETTKPKTVEAKLDDAQKFIASSSAS
jgi:thiol-disulfide isomerase/thioredoxin